MARIYDNIDIKFTDGLRGIIENIGAPFLRDKLKRDLRLQELVGADDD